MKYVAIILLTFLVASNGFAQDEKPKRKGWRLFGDKEKKEAPVVMEIDAKDTLTFDSTSVEAAETIENQELTVTAGNSGTVNIIQDARIDSLLAKSKRIDSTELVIHGYRVQIFSISGPNSRSKAQEIQADFLAKYPDLNSYTRFYSPNWKVRIGDCPDRLQATKLMREIDTHFPNAFIVKDRIELVE